MIAELEPYRAYKASGVPWLGAVPEHWTIRRLRASITDCINGVWGGDPNGKDDLICVRVADFDRVNLRVSLSKRTLRAIPLSARPRRLLRKGDLLLEKSGGGDMQPVGAVVLYDHDKPAVCSNFVARMPVASGYDSFFVNYLHRTLYAHRVNIPSIKQTTGIQNLDGKAYLSESVAFPPAEEQAAIVRFLDWANGLLERAIRAKRKVIALLNEQKQAVIHRAVTRGLDPSVPLKPSGIPWIGDIPRHWGISSVKRLSRRGGKSFTDGDWIELPFITNTGVRLIQTGNVGKGSYREKGFRYISERTFEAFGCTEVEPNDVLICRLDGPVGRACLAPDLGVRMITSVDNTILKVRPEIDARFVVFLMSSTAWLNWIQSMCRAGGGFRYRISRSMLGGLLVATPPLPEQLAITNFITGSTAPLTASVERLEREIELLREYRTRLVADVVTGKLDVREAAARLPDEVVADTVTDDSELGDEAEIADDEVAV